jgi:hypothetical protein
MKLMMHLNKMENDVEEKLLVCLSYLLIDCISIYTRIIVISYKTFTVMEAISSIHFFDQKSLGSSLMQC